MIKIQLLTLAPEGKFMAIVIVIASAWWYW